jgi:hypothetical protein
MASESSELSSSLGGAATRERSSFFLVAHGVLLLIVLVGFAPSFYLRSTFPHVHQLPVFLHVHGAVLTGWFVLTVVQGWLIRSQRYRLHRKLGYFAAAYAAVVIMFGTLAALADFRGWDGSGQKLRDRRFARHVRVPGDL